MFITCSTPQTYDEIIDLAGKGDNANVDLYPKDLERTDSDDGYAKAVLAQDRGDIIFHFHKAVGKKLGKAALISWCDLWTLPSLFHPKLDK